MTGFAFGMLAALLWIAAMVGIGYLMRSSPGHPFRTIRHFRLAGRTLAEVPVPDPDHLQEEPTELPEPPRSHELEVSGPSWTPPEVAGDWAMPDSPRDWTTSGAPTELSQEVLALVGLGSPPGERGPTTRRKPAPAKKGPRRNGRIEYIVVDQDGRPEI